VVAFALPETSKDAAVQSRLPVNQGGYSVRISAGSDAGGIALTEIFGADREDSPVRSMNVSTLGFVGTGDEVLAPGFVIRGTGSKRVLIRAVGPGQTQLGVSGVLTDPRIAMYSAGAGAPMASNDDWSGSAVLKATFTEVGAFSILDCSKDAAVIVTLPAGAYTVVVSGAGSSSGVALVEVYDLDP